MENLTTKKVLVGKYNGTNSWEEGDLLAVEEPLEISLQYGSPAQPAFKNLSVTMRTPGADDDLAIGFLFTEGILQESGDVDSTRILAENSILVSLKSGLAVDMKKLDRHFYTTSSCGVCGKTSMDAVRVAAASTLATDKPAIQIRPEVIYALPDKLREAQSTFDATGGLHASAVFDLEGNLRCLREDVGRHNALDKLIGHYFRLNQLPLDQHILLLSGRASFELLQKAAMAGVQCVCAVGAPSSLAVETAESFGITLVGFLREGRFNVYSGLKMLHNSS